jgi:hypothetical protein
MQKQQMPPTQAPQRPPPTPASANLIAQGKSVKDEPYIADRRRQLGDEIFEDLLRTKDRFYPGGGAPEAGLPQQQLQFN